VRESVERLALARLRDNRRDVLFGDYSDLSTGDIFPSSQRRGICGAVTCSLLNRVGHFAMLAFLM